MGLVVGIDTSSSELSIGLVKDGNAVAAYTRYARNSHAEYIAQTVGLFLDSNNIRAKEIEKMGVACGPGSFTGLRIGLSFVKGFLTGSDTPVLPVSSLESVAQAWNQAKGAVAVAFDARQNRVFGARFRVSDQGLERLGNDTLMPINDFIDNLDEHDHVLTDTMGYAKSTVFECLAERNYVYSLQSARLNRGLASALIASKAPRSSEEWITSMELQPRYLQPSYAEAQAAKVTKRS